MNWTAQAKNLHQTISVTAKHIPELCPACLLGVAARLAEGRPDEPCADCRGTGKGTLMDSLRADRHNYPCGSCGGTGLDIVVQLRSVQRVFA